MSDTAVPQPPRPQIPLPPAPLAGRDFRDPATLTQWLKVLLVLSLLLDFIATVSGMMELALLRSLQNETFTGDFAAAATSNDNRQQAIGVAQFALFVVTDIVFLTWIHRVNRNARALGAEGMRFTPGWSVGWFFVPIMNLWRPFQVMREIWQASAQPGNWRAVQAPPLLGWWWAMFLGRQILGQIGHRLSDSIRSVDDAVLASVITTLSDISAMALDVLAFVLVGKIVANQIWQTKTVEVF
jgi:hypothetical protein